MAAPRVTRDIVGDAVQRVRTDIGWTQEHLGSRIGQTQGWISRVENAQVPGLTFDSAERILAAMGARLVVSIDAPFLGDRRRQREPGHTRMAAYSTARLVRDGWEVASEVEIGGDRSRGWIDLLAFHPATGLLLVIELKTEIHDLGAIQRSLGWYQREAWRAARRLGWTPRFVGSCLLLLATDANDVRARENREALAAEFPERAPALAAIVRRDSPVATPRRSVAMVDPRSRRRAWLISLRMDGRRSVAPYRDYADFMRLSTSRRR